MPENDVTEAVKILVKEFIPLKINDLQEWERNPEQWVNDEDAENDQWEYELRVRACPIVIVAYTELCSHVVNGYCSLSPINIASLSYPYLWILSGTWQVRIVWFLTTIRPS
jgi:hypothetical protein